MDIPCLNLIGLGILERLWDNKLEFATLLNKIKVYKV